MTTENTPESFAEHLGLIRRYAADDARPLPDDFAACLYYNINVGDDRERSLAESKRFLEAYYMTTFSPEFLERWVAVGSVEDCVAHLRRFIDAGATTITLRLVGDNQESQYDQVTNRVLPQVLGAVA